MLSPDEEDRLRHVLENHTFALPIGRFHIPRMESLKERRSFTMNVYNVRFNKGDSQDESRFVMAETATKAEGVISDMLALANGDSDSLRVRSVVLVAEDVIFEGKDI